MIMLEALIIWVAINLFVVGWRIVAWAEARARRYFDHIDPPHRETQGRNDSWEPTGK